MGWEQEQRILHELATLQATCDYIKKQFTVLTQFTTIVAQQLPVLASNMIGISAEVTAIKTTLDSLLLNSNTCCGELNVKLDEVAATELVLVQAANKILVVLVPPPAVSFTATVTLDNFTSTVPLQGENMANKAAGATADLQVSDTGTFSVSLSFVDADGFKTPTPAGLSATYTASDSTPGPSILTLTPSADTSSCAGGVDQATAQAIAAAGGALPTGLTVSVSATWTGLASPVTVVAAPPIDVVAGPAASFVAAATTP